MNIDINRMSKKNLETLDFRRIRLNGKLRRLEAMASGLDTSVLCDLRDASGRWSEGKTWQLADRLADAAEHVQTLREEGGDAGTDEAFFRKLDLTAGVDGGSGLQGEPGPESEEQRFLRWYRQANPRKSAQTRERRAFFRSFFYCALRLAEADPFWLMEARGSYEDVLELARGLRYTEPAELHFQELYSRPGTTGTFAVMDSLYLELTGESVTRTLTAGQRRLARELHPDRSAGAEAARRQIEEEDLFIETSEEESAAAREYYDSLSNEERIRMADEDRWMLREQNRRQAWLDGFPARERFCQEYLRWRELYFALEDRQEIPRMVERALAACLCGDSAILDDDRFFSAYVLLDNAAARLQREEDEEAYEDDEEDAEGFPAFDEYGCACEHGYEEE